MKGPCQGFLLTVSVLCAVRAVKGNFTLEVSVSSLSFLLHEGGSFGVKPSSSVDEAFTVALHEVKEDPNEEDILKLTDGLVYPKDLKSFVEVNLTASRAGKTVISFNTSRSDVMTTGVYVRVSVSKVSGLDVLSSVIGWIYFAAWSVSFYPQIYINWKRKSVVGLNFDFLGLNITGFLFYLFFNSGLYFSDKVQKEYLSTNPAGVIPVEINDVVFAVHAVFATTVTITQCFLYTRNGQRVSRLVTFLLAAVWAGAVVFLIVVAAGGIKSQPWLTYLYYFSYVKLGVTLIKYIPQAYMNYKRKSTVGWSIGNILLDFTGGCLSILQMFIIAHNYDDWHSIFGNFTKFGLGFLSILFDIIFIVQHYVLYRDRSEKEMTINQDYSDKEKV